MCACTHKLSLLEEQEVCGYRKLISMVIISSRRFDNRGKELSLSLEAHLICTNGCLVLPARYLRHCQVSELKFLVADFILRVCRLVLSHKPKSSL